MTNVSCVKNLGYKWHINGGVHFKGFFIDENVLYKGMDAVDKLSKLNSYDEFIGFLQVIYGNFAMIIKNQDETWAAVDIARSIPIYFSANGEVVSDCAETIRKDLKFPPGRVNTKNITSLLYARFAFLNNTAYDDIKQLNLGQTLRVRHTTQHNTTQHYYYRHIADVTKRNKQEAIVSLKSQLDSVFDRAVKAIDGRPVLLSLSGGYDSRLVACMLKEKGVSEVVCYTYGSKDSYEVEISKKVADSLGYEWHCVTYSDDDIKSIFSSENDEFFDFVENHDYVVYLQNFIAVKRLMQSGNINPNSVVITGLCGDMPSGTYVLPQEQLVGIELSYDNMAKKYVLSLFQRFNINPQMETELTNEVKSDIKACDLKLKNVQDYITLKDCMETAGVHSRVFLQANRVHEFFGFEWLLPLWDKDYLSFWYSLPMEFRVNQNLYEEYLLNHLWSKYDISYKKMKAVRAADKNKRKIGANYIKELKYLCGGILTRLSFVSGIPIKRKISDPNNFSAATVWLYKNIKNKSLINYQKANFGHLCNIYILEKRYGRFNLK